MEMYRLIYTMILILLNISTAFLIYLFVFIVYIVNVVQKTHDTINNKINHN